MGVCNMVAVLLRALCIGLGWAWVACGILRGCVMTCVFMGLECWLMFVVRRMIGAQVYSVVCWLFGCGLVGFLVVLLCHCFRRSW